MLIFPVLAILCVPYSIRAIDEGTNDNKTSCMEQFLEWCDRTEQQPGNGVSVMSFAYNDDKGFHRVFCLTDSEGTNCTKSGSPWFQCASDRSLTYKGQPLTRDTAAADVDDDICESADKAFRDLKLQNFGFNNETLKEFQKDMDSFYEAMLELRQQMRDLQKRLSDGSFLGPNFMDGFGDWLYPASNGSSDESSDANSTDSNQLEKE